jgi:hypothetical protein
MKNAIVILLNNQEKDIFFFRKSFPFLIKNYLSKFPCKLILLHESDFPAEEKELIWNYYCENLKDCNLDFFQIDFKIPDHPKNIIDKIPEYVPHPDFPNANGFGMGYRHMCRFFAGDIFKLDILKDYKYVLRLDTDSFLVDVKYNLFDRMASTESKYGYINIQYDHPKLIDELWSFSKDYFKEKEIYTDVFKPPHIGRVFYTNFEIFDMDFFKQPDYMDFFNKIDESGGIYLYRWGDHCIRYIALNCLLEKSKMLFFNDVDYFHSERYYNREFLCTE